ncbi:MAG: asparaginase [Pseudomonadota bacterium]
MSAPLTVIDTRGTRLENRHVVHAAVADPAGHIVAAHGEADRLIYPRSAIKALQAIPGIESGAADAAGATPPQLALAASSHSGEPDHAREAAAMLAAIGLDHTALQCGILPPRRAEDREAMRRAGHTATALNHPCSGKHAMMLILARHLGARPETYTDPNNRVQEEIAAALTAHTGAAHRAAGAGIDNCSVPTWALPLAALATGFARLASARASPGRANAMQRVLEACISHPYMVAGTGRACTRLMEALAPRVFAKSGADGVYVAALPAQGLGIALKVEAGNKTASEVAITHLIARHLGVDEAERAALAPLACQPRHSVRGAVVGQSFLADDMGREIPIG